MTDLRTKAGREEEVLQEIRDYRGLSTFWVTECQARACAADRLINSGRIKRTGEFPFPFVGYEIGENNEYINTK